MAIPQHSPLVHFEFDARAFVPGSAHHLLLGNGKRKVGHHAAASRAQEEGRHQGGVDILLPKGPSHSFVSPLSS